jgi:hypothetical protein
MTKAYKVVTGHKKDYYGYPTEVEIAKYFFNKEDAETEYKKGEYTFEQTVIYTTYKDGTVGRAITGAIWYEEEKKDAKPNEKVVKETVIDNHYRMEEIEIN